MSDAVAIAIIASLPSIILAIVNLIAILKGHYKIDAVKDQVNGSLSKLLEAVAVLSQRETKTVVVEGRRQSDKEIKVLPSGPPPETDMKV